MTPVVTIRDMVDDDRETVLALLGASLGWEVDDRHRALFAWKHDHNPYGRSFAWVAEHPTDGVVGFRTFLRWRFVSPDGRLVDAVRAVDTATAPSHRGGGIFRRLTLHALEHVEQAGISFVFNTPNEQSRPGYLKMGWQEVGRLPVEARPRGIGGAVTLVQSRVPAALWSTESQAGLDAGDFLADDSAVEALLAWVHRPGAWSTDRSAEQLRWRYAGLPDLRYRVVVAEGGPSEGAIVLRLRRRGRALECAVVDVFAPRDRRRRGALARRALRASGADYALALGSDLGSFVSARRLGPVLTWRHLGTPDAAPPIGDWALVLGDVELF